MKHNLIVPEVRNSTIKLIVIDIENIPEPSVAKQVLIDMEHHGYKLAVVAHYFEGSKTRGTFQSAIDYYKTYHITEHINQIIDLVDDRYVRAMNFFKLERSEILVITDNAEAVKLAKEQSISVFGYSEGDNPLRTKELADAGASKIFYSIEFIVELLSNL